MQISLLLWSALGLASGGAIGYFFGRIQDMAHRRNELREQSGKLKSGWAVMPGSMRRVGFLVLALVLVQAICPLMFVGGVQWTVSAGVVLGYGVVLYAQLRQKMAQNKS